MSSVSGDAHLGFSRRYCRPWSYERRRSQGLSATSFSLSVEVERASVLQAASHGRTAKLHCPCELARLTADAEPESSLLARRLLGSALHGLVAASLLLYALLASTQLPASHQDCLAVHAMDMHCANTRRIDLDTNNKAVVQPLVSTQTPMTQCAAVAPPREVGAVLSSTPCFDEINDTHRSSRLCSHSQAFPLLIKADRTKPAFASSRLYKV